jgi:hypothetical protein
LPDKGEKQSEFFERRGEKAMSRHNADSPFWLERGAIRFAISVG